MNKKLKVYLIEPLSISYSSRILTVTPNPNNFGSLLPTGIWEPYSLECLGAYVKEVFPFLDIEILQDSVVNVSKKLLPKIKLKKYEKIIIGVSTYTYMFPEILSFLSNIKKFGKVITVVGGYHPSGTEEEIVKYPQIDFVIVGEGEIPFLKLIQNILNESLPPDKILYSLGKISMSQFPYPLRFKKYLMRAKSYPLAYPSPPEQRAPAMITYGRGCYFKCPFCASSLIWKSSKISFRSVEKVVNEIKYLKEKFGTNLLYWTDLAINNNKKKLIELLTEIVNSKIKINSFGYVNQRLDEETCYLLKQSGFRRLGYGVETLKPNRLKQIKRFQNLERVKRALEIADGMGIITRAYLMIGFPDEEPKEIIELIDSALDLPIDQVRLGFFTPFVGTPLYEKCKNLLTEDWKRFTGDVPVFLHHIKYEDEWIKTRKMAIKKFYTSEKYRKRIENKIKRFPYLKNSFKFFFNELKGKINE
jgi:radical SAM superfamily enzyme YgiQ (UPF0313 family)